MKILLWAPFGAGTHYWGPGTNAYRLYKSASLEGHEVSLAHGTVLQQPHKDLYKETIFISDLKKGGAWDQLKFLWASYRWIKKNAQRFDVIHCIGAFETGYRPALWMTRHGKAAFVKLTGNHGGFGENSRLSKLLGLDKHRFRTANEISGYIAISSSIQENLLKYGIEKDKIHLIPNGVDVNRFKPVTIEEKKSLRTQLGWGEEFTVLLVGGICHNKRNYEAVLAVHHLVQQGLTVKLVLLGPDRSEGIELAKIKQYISKHQLSQQVLWVDHTSDPVPYYQASDLFILPSKYEGMPNALLEAMACALPSVVTPVSGSKDLVKDGDNGYYTDGTPEDLAQKILKVYQNRKTGTAFGEKSLNKILSDYSGKEILRKHLTLFQTCQK